MIETVSQNVEYASAGRNRPDRFTRNIPLKAIPAMGIFWSFAAKKGQDAICRRFGSVGVSAERGVRNVKLKPHHLGCDLLLHADTVEIRAVAAGVRVGITRCSRLTNDIAQNG